MRAKPYPKYKPSGVQWLGDIPKHWAAKRLKYVSSTNDEILPETTDPDFEFSYVDIGSVNFTDGITSTESMVFENAPSRARRIVQDGDTIVSTVRTYLRAIAPIKNPPPNLIVSTGFAVIRPRKIEPAFLAHALREPSFVESVVARSVGVSYPAVNASDVGGISIPLPPPDEQRAIAEFLDRETAKIDRLVEKQKTLIERLKEKRTALISHVVTKGLDSKVKMKPSGIPWLGDIPEHWKARRLKDHCTLIGGAGFPCDEQGVEDEELPFYKVGDLVLSSDGRHMGKAQNTISRVTATDLRAHIIPASAVIYAKIGAALLLNRRRETSVSCCIDNNMTACIPNGNVVTTGWVYHWMSALDFGEFMNPGAVPSFSEGYQAVLPLLVPPLAEQQTIAAHLDRETGRIDALVSKVEQAIERLQEYRTALISEAVTGKIDVRAK